MEVQGFHDSQSLRTGEEHYTDKFFWMCDALLCCANFDDSERFCMWCKMLLCMSCMNDNTCYWQSICSEEVVHRASFLTRFFEATSGGQHVDLGVFPSSKKNV